VKLIVSFAQEKKEVDKFLKIAAEVKETSTNQDRFTAIFLGFFRFAIFALYIYSCWIASVLIYN
jgi:hypothetical protein